MPDLRSVLRQRVRDSQEELERRRPLSGTFLDLEGRTDIRFVTTGRKTGRVHEKWWLPFAPDGDTLYLLEERGEAADWVRNGLASGTVVIEGREASVRVVTDPNEVRRARELCQERFARTGLAVQDLVETGLVIAFDAI